MADRNIFTEILEGFDALAKQRADAASIQNKHATPTTPPTHTHPNPETESGARLES